MKTLIIAAFASFIMASGTAGPTDEMFAELKSAPSDVVAESLADDINESFRESGSATADILLERAMMAETIEDYEMAREFLDRAILVEPSFSEAWFRRSLLFMEDELIDQALYDLNEALTHEPRHFRAWLTLAGVFEMLGQNKQALEAYREVVKIYPRHPGANSQIRRLAPLVDGRAI